MDSLFNREGRAMTLMTWLANMVHIQLLWLAFSLMGLIAGGVFPATFTMLTMMKKLIIEKDTFRLNKTFRQSYKKQFVKSNMIGYGLFFIGLLIRYYLALSLSLQNQLSQIYSMLAIFIIFMFVSIVLWFLPIYVQFESSLKNHLKSSLILMFSYPLHTMGMFFTLLIFYVSVLKLPVLLPFVSVGVLAYAITHIVMDAIKRSDEKLNISHKKR